MNALDTLFQSCIPKEEPPKYRRPSNFSVSSTQSKTQLVINAIEREFGIIVDAVQEIPNVIEEKFEELVQTVVDIPAALEESFDDFIHAMQDKLSLQPKSPCVKVSFDDFERTGQVDEGTALVLREDLHFSALMESPNSDGERDSGSTRSTPSLEEGDTEMYLMELTSPGLQTPRVSIVQPQTSTVRCVADSDNSSTETLISGALVVKTAGGESSEECTQPLVGAPFNEQDEEVGSRWWLKPDGSVGRAPHQIAEGVLAV